ncbi:hypothetical protein LguiB_031895 [Lonicera macranthoides]
MFGSTSGVATGSLAARTDGFSPPPRPTVKVTKDQGAVHGPGFVVIAKVDCPCVTPEVVLEASSHVDNFTNIIVKDEKTRTCYSAEHLIKDFCKEKLEKDANISNEKLAELNHMLAALDQMIFLLKN